jgi:hypothetical protein
MSLSVKVTEEVNSMAQLQKEQIYLLLLSAHYFGKDAIKKFLDLRLL